MDPGRHSNRLARETSPYLQQHAGNPVDWYPWGDAALMLARESDKPILLSVGYSACHWCHVMAHECFEDDETAALMNRHFINVKVDREERPDVDQVYQTAHQLIAQGAGGWPLTMFLTPDGKPFYGGTYFPKRPRYGRPGFDQLLRRIAELWRDDRADLLKNGDAMVKALESTVIRRTGDRSRAGGADSSADGDASVVADSSGSLDRVAKETSRALIAQMMKAFDARHGGFGRAPKFPQPSVLSALLREAVVARDDRARDAVLLTLTRMAEGGLYDHLAGGFYRYSTDDRWLIPHFEKMLYDNGPLLRVYAEAWQLTREPLFRDVCEGVAAWMIGEMQSPDSSEGGYHSSFDADSEGEEGRFYVWTGAEIAAHLTGDEFAVFAPRYGLDEPPNFEDRHWHLHVARPIAAIAASLQRTGSDVAATLAVARNKLMTLRASRVKPGRDDKILTSWNALAIEAMLFASRVLDRPEWHASAARALDFIRATLWRDGRLLATYKDGRAHLNAYLDDHAFLLGALVESMQHGALRAGDLEWARAIADVLLDRFEDPTDGGFFFTSHDHEALVLRPKPGYDNATPSGNGAAAMHLQRFGHLVGDLRYVRAAERTMSLFAGQASQVPQAFATLAAAIAEHAAPAPIVIIADGTDERAIGSTATEWQRELARLYAPGLLAFRIAARTLGELPQAMRKPHASATQAWICRGAQCLPPVTDLHTLLPLVR